VLVVLLTPGVRDLYPSTSKFARRGIVDSTSRAQLPEPTMCCRGTLDKVRVLEDARLGQQLWHPLDAKLDLRKLAELEVDAESNNARAEHSSRDGAERAAARSPVLRARPRPVRARSDRGATPIPGFASAGGQRHHHRPPRHLQGPLQDPARRRPVFYPELV